MKPCFASMLAIATVLTTATAHAAAPTVACSGSQMVHCTSSNGALAVVQVTVQDADGDALSVVSRINQNGAVTNMLPAGMTTNVLTLSFTNAFPLGTNVFRVSVSDGTSVVM